MRKALGIAFVALGCVALAWLFLQPVVSARQTAQAQERLATELPAGPELSGPAGVPVARSTSRGEALTVMEIPRFGADWRWVTVEGTELDQLAEGPGHYVRTPLPGARGNVAFAGHRAGHGSPFINFDLLEVGDDVMLEQGDVRWTYRIEKDPKIVPVDSSWVLRASAQRELTLTTCWPKYGSSRRMYVRAQLVEVEREDNNAAWTSVWTPSENASGAANARAVAKY